jgi:hypothetical protein
MKKLEDIPKKEVFNVPDGYFDKLPGIIQARVAKPEKESSPVWGFALRYALPTVVLLAVGIVWFNQSSKVVDAEQLLSSIQTEDLLAYLNDSDMTTEELLADVELSDDDAKEIEGNVYDLNLDDDSLDDIVSEMELDNF